MAISALAFTHAPVAMAVVRDGRVVEASAVYTARFGATVADGTVTALGEGLALVTVREDPAVRWLRSIVDNSAALVYVKDFQGRWYHTGHWPHEGDHQQ